MPTDHAFAAIAATDRMGDWTINATEESAACIARRGDDPPLVLVAGRQIVTGEGLEILALAAPGPFADGLPIEAGIAAVRAAGGIVVLPWGFGKWWGRRGRTIEHCLAGAEPGTLFLGDNGGRLAAAPPPRQFAIAERQGLMILPGSDPLPLAAEHDAVARYGFVLDAPEEALPHRPAAWLKERLATLAEQPRSFGRRQAVMPFMARQLAMQWRKRQLGR
jgi:hypothetical protein